MYARAQHQVAGFQVEIITGMIEFGATLADRKPQRQVGFIGSLVLRETRNSIDYCFVFHLSNFVTRLTFG